MIIILKYHLPVAAETKSMKSLPGVGHEVRLELVEVDVKGAVEAEGGRDARHDLRKTIEQW
jgi:hypothetical protein